MNILGIFPWLEIKDHCGVFLLEILDQFYLSAVRFVGNIVGLGFWGWEMVAGEEGKGIIYGVTTIRWDLSICLSSWKS